MFLALAFVSIVPLGWLLTNLLIPEVHANCERWALIGTVGYAASVLVGFFSGVLGLGNWYLSFSFICLATALAWRISQIRSENGIIGKPTQWLHLNHWWASKPACVVPALSALGVLVSTPLMAPIRKVSSSLHYDYSFIDTYFQTARAQVLMQGAPAYTSADLAGARPFVYPDFHNFWMGQIAAWSGIDVNSVYFIYTPIAMIGLRTLLMYAVGKTLTGSCWGGYIGAVLPYILLVPNVYDVDGVIVTAALIHFLDLRANLSEGVAGMLVAAVALVMSLSLRTCYGRRTMFGLLTIGGCLIVVMLRVRPHFFFPLLPWYGVFVLLQARRRKDVGYALPLVITGLLFALLYGESTSGHYDTTSTRLALDYGRFQGLVMPLLPGVVQGWLGQLPSIIQPLAVAITFSVMRVVGTVFSLILAGYMIAFMMRRVRLSLVEVCFVLVWLSALVAGSIVVLEARRTQASGAWGFQVFIMSLPLAGVLAIVPAYQVLRALALRIPALMERRHVFAVGALALATVVAYRGADSTLRGQVHRAYPITQDEMGGYYWIATNTPQTAVVAAHPRHRVNGDGETVESTNFLSGLTRRPAYLQRVEAYGLSDAAGRREILLRLFEADAVGAVMDAVKEATFDYLLVYRDTPPRMDLSCCLTLVFDREIKIYHRDAPPNHGSRSLR
jgi:hypothetical protein